MKLSRLPLLAVFLVALCAPAARAQNTPGTEPQKPKPIPGQPADPKILEGIFTCLSKGLPANWKKAWFVIHQTGADASDAARQFEAEFFFATDMIDTKGKPLVPCGSGSAPVLEGVLALNQYLPQGQQRWTGTIFTFTKAGDGVKFGATYDYTPVKPAPAAAPVAATPAKPAAKKPESK